jgi:hypothetical protein
MNTIEQITRSAVEVLLASARQIDSVLTAGSLENAHSSVDESARKRAIQDALEDVWSARGLSRTA